jgi:hypothetical protein
VERRDHHAGLLPPVISVITITGIGDHLQPEWLITFTGIRTSQGGEGDALPGSCSQWQQTGNGIAGCGLFDCARDPSACFDLNLAISDRAGHVTTRTDQQPFADHEFALKPAPHIRVFSRGVPVEHAGFGDNHMLAFLQFRFDRALDDKPVAGSDLTRQGNSLSDDQRSAINLMTM